MHAERRIIAAILTVLLHLLVLSSLVRITADSVKPPQPSSVEKATTADKLRSAGEQVISVDIRPGLSTLRGMACPMR